MDEGQRDNREFYFSVIIPTYNRREMLERALLCLEEQSLPTELYEVIVVNDGSTDDTAEFLERYKNRAKMHFTYINKDNEGQGIARNTGFQLSDGYVILFGQDDILVTKDFLSEHKKVHDRFATSNFICLGHTTWHPELVVSPYMQYLEESGTQFGYKQLAKSRLIDPKLGLRLAGYPYFYTSNISLKRPLFEKHQFDERFKKYGWEDIELGYRLVQDGAMILYNDAAMAYHHHEQHEDEIPKRMKQVGRAAKRAIKIQPKLHVIPSGVKRLLLSIIAMPVFVQFWKNRWDASGKQVLNFVGRAYYYSAMKQYFLLGLKKKR